MSEEEQETKPKRRAAVKKEKPKTDYITNFDWQTLIPKGHVQISNQWYSKEGINPSTLSEDEKAEILESGKVPEDQKLILLAGFKALAHIRGIESVDYETISHDKESCSVKCSVRFHDYVSEAGVIRGGQYSALACASKENTSPPFDKFLESMAENRAFIRAIRMAMNINILGDSEVEQKPCVFSQDALLSDEPECTTPQDSLRILVAQLGKNFTHLKGSLLKQIEKFPDAEKWEDFKDIPATDCFLIIEGIKDKRNVKKEAAPDE